MSIYVADSCAIILCNAEDEAHSSHWRSRPGGMDGPLAIQNWPF